MFKIGHKTYFKKFSFFALLTIILILFFYPFFVQGKVPVPSDALLGMYHPYRDWLVSDYPNGVPFKNFLITDPVRQIIPWKKLAVDLLSQGQLPLWNPYGLSGTPLLGNGQSSPFYPFNLLLFFDFFIGWGVFIWLQVFLGALFLYLYLRQQKLSSIASITGSLSWVFSGFFLAWLEWGNIIHTVIWLPLILLSLDKAWESLKKTNKKELTKYLSIFTLGLSASFFAGHLQSFFYICLFVSIYFIWKFTQYKRIRKKALLAFSISFFIILLLTAIQWFPLFKFISLSARDVDRTALLSRPDWFLPWQHLLQLLIPDFFGNPATQNYWGVWNYGEFVSYIGIVPLFLAGLALLSAFRKPGVVRLFGLLLILFLSLALPTWWAKLPYLLNVPLLSSAQPSRIIVLVDFCLVVLVAFGFELLITKIKNNAFSRSFFISVLAFFALFILLWLAIGLGFFSTTGSATDLTISKRNMVFPSLIWLGFVGIIALLMLLGKKFRKKQLFITFAVISIVGIITLDLFRFFHKFTPFSLRNWFFPSTKSIEFLQKDKDIFRIMTTDRQLLPSNVAAYYHIQSVSGYDPLYLKTYAEFIAANERGRPDISPPFAYNRIIEPQNYQSRLMDLLNVKYVLSLDELDSDKLDLVFSEGKTKIYQNQQAFARAWLTYDLIQARSKQEMIEYCLDDNIDLKKTAIVYAEDVIELPLVKEEKSSGDVKIQRYQENIIELSVTSSHESILVLADVYYPGWQVKIDNRKATLFPVDYLLRGVAVPAGKHTVEFSPTL